MRYKLIELLKDLSQMQNFHNFYLEGGSALSLVYSVNRNNSWDLDFTVDPNVELEIFMKNMQDQGIGDVTFDHREDITSIAVGRGVDTFILDVIKVRPNLFCWRERTLNLLDESFRIKVHTIEDIFCEKVCCVFTREKINDLIDLGQILNQFDLQQDTVTSQMSRKLIVKNLDPRELLLEIPSRFVEFSLMYKYGADIAKYPVDVEFIFEYIRILLLSVTENS